jgi:3-hexulose-6-phosphate synthase
MRGFHVDSASIATGDKAVVQVSIDVPTVDEALAVAEMAARAGVDWLEVGTPLILFSGIPAIREIAGAFPGREIFADLKLVDGARKYVVSAAAHGATMVSVCGVAADATIREAVAGGRESGCRVVVDLYASPDPVRRAREVADIGADLVYIHYGGDAHFEAPDLDNTLGLIPKVCASVNVPVGVVTFDAEGAVAAVREGANVVLVGHPYLLGTDAEGMLTDYVQRVHSVSGAGSARNRPRAE